MLVNFSHFINNKSLYFKHFIVVNASIFVLPICFTFAFSSTSNSVIRVPSYVFLQATNVIKCACISKEDGI